MKKCCEGMCRPHCPAFCWLLFSLLGLWFMLGRYGIQTMGDFWSWFVLIFGICCTLKHLGKSNPQNCPWGGLPLIFSLAIAAVGGWYVLADMFIVPPLGMELLHVMTFLIPLKIASCTIGFGGSSCGCSGSCNCSNNKSSAGSSMNQ